MSNLVEPCSNVGSSSPKKQRERKPLDPAKMITVDEYDPEDFCPDGVTEVDHEVWAKYLQQIEASQGFDIDDFPGICPMTSYVPIHFENSHSETETLVELATLAIQHYNKSLRRTRYEFVKVERATARGCAGIMYYITFQAKERKKRHPAVKTFQAQVWYGVCHAQVEFCRLKKMPDQKVPSESPAQ